MQKYGLNLLKGLDNKEKDDALKLYDIQSNFFLGLQYTHMFCSDRLFNILSVGCRYVQEDDLEVLLRIGEFDKTLEYFGVNKNEIFITVFHENKLMNLQKEWISLIEKAQKMQ